ncbi:MAG: hypothetical protein ABW022_14695 [Actinoplanes sp.]
MDRGPVALFVSIVAVGLGPALWLGVQFGAVEIAPVPPPAISEQKPGGQELLGGAGAGSAATADGEPVVRTTPRSNTLPLTKSASPSPSSSPSADAKPSSSPTQSADPDDDPSPTGTGPAEEPTQPGSDETDDPTIPPAPPGASPDPTDPTPDEGGIGAGENVAGKNLAG